MEELYFVSSISGCSPVTLSPSVNIVGDIETTLLDVGTDTYGSFLKATDSTLTLFEHGSDTIFQIMDDPVSWGELLNFDATGRLYVKGNIGIGTPNPEELLHVSGSTSTQIKVTGGLNAGIIIDGAENSFVEYKEDAARKWIVGNHQSDDHFKWATGTTFNADTVNGTK